jgi:hypothetical protein
MPALHVDGAQRASASQETDGSEPRAFPVPALPAIGAAEDVQDGGGGKEPVPVRGMRHTWQWVPSVRASANQCLLQPFSWKAGLLFILTGGGLVWYFENEKGRMQRKRIAESTKGVGRPKVGGPFELIDQDGNTVTDKDLKGRHSLVSAARD